MTTLALLQELSRVVEDLVEDYKARVRRMEERRQAKARDESEMLRMAAHTARAVADYEESLQKHLTRLEELDDLDEAETMGQSDEAPQVEARETFKAIPGGRSGDAAQH